MTLKRVKTARGKSSEGLSINLSDYGAGANVNLTFKSEKNNKTGKKNYTFKGESKQKSKMVTSDMSYDGKKISDEIIELK